MNIHRVILAYLSTKLEVPKRKSKWGRFRVSGNAVLFSRMGQMNAVKQLGRDELGAPVGRGIWAFPFPIFDESIARDRRMLLELSRSKAINEQVSKLFESRLPEIREIMTEEEFAKFSSEYDHEDLAFDDDFREFSNRFRRDFAIDGVFTVRLGKVESILHEIFEYGSGLVSDMRKQIAREVKVGKIWYSGVVYGRIDHEGNIVGRSSWVKFNTAKDYLRAAMKSFYRDHGDQIPEDFGSQQHFEVFLPDV